MLIDKNRCIGCKKCHPHCPVGVISVVDWNGKSKCEVNQDKWVESASERVLKLSA